MEVARALLNRGMSMAEVGELTGLTKNEIEQIKEIINESS